MHSTPATDTIATNFAPVPDDIAPPARPMRAPSGAAAEPAAPRPASPPHILIIDDHSHDSWAWAGALRRAGFRVGIAEDAYAGLHALDADAYTLLITNQDRNGSADQELIRKARAVPERLPCLLIGEQESPDNAPAAELLRPCATLKRPVTISNLLATVRRLLVGDVDPRAVTTTPSGPIPFPIEA